MKIRYGRYRNSMKFHIGDGFDQNSHFNSILVINLIILGTGTGKLENSEQYIVFQKDDFSGYD